MQLVGKGPGLKIDESSLTGESAAISRSVGDQVSLMQQYWIRVNVMHMAHLSVHVLIIALFAWASMQIP